MARTIADVADEIQALNIELKELGVKVAAAEEKKRFLEHELSAMAADAKLTEGKGKTSKFKIAPSVVPVVSPEDWDKLYKFIHRNKWYHLLERRPSVSGCRELWAQGKEIPGVGKFTKMKVTVTGA